MENNNEIPQEGGQRGLFGVIRTIAHQLLVMYLFRQYITGSPGTNVSAPVNASWPPAHNLFFPGQHYDLSVYLHDKIDFSVSDATLFWQLQDLEFGNWNEGPNKDSVFEKHGKLPNPEFLLRNESLYMHVILTKHGHPIDQFHLSSEIAHYVRQLNKYKKRQYKKTVNLLTGESQHPVEEQQKAEDLGFEILNYWHPNITLNIAYDQQTLNKGTPLANMNVRFTEDGKFYHPLFMFNSFWNLNSDYKPISVNDTEIELRVVFQPISLMKFMIYHSWEARSHSQYSFMEVDNDDEGDDNLKTALIETNPILLVLHMIFEFLAFKSDIQFWHSKNDLSGLSVKMVLFNIFQSVVVFLYVCDNDTNFMVKASTGIGLFIECWKIPKINWEQRIFGVFPKISFSDKGTYVESETKIYDEMAFKYLSWVLFPLLLCYGGYSLLYNEHKGWYSFVLSLLYGFLLTFGFIAMTPQLFINYKLKSVAHLPWRMMTYKFINTFIDDLFAFVTRMPWLYRISCFRDDLIFLIYLYQRWIYRVDPKRVNEYGIAIEDPSNEGEKQETKKEK